MLFNYTMTNSVQPCFDCVIINSFQNVEYELNDVTTIITNCKAELTPSQLEKLTYPDGYTPIDIYIYQQVNRDVPGIASLISFITKNDLLYGYYFDITPQNLDIEFMRTTCDPVSLNEDSVITDIQFIEIYLNINGTTLSLILSAPSTGVQYRTTGCQYNAIGLDLDGASVRFTTLTGLSNTLIGLENL